MDHIAGRRAGRDVALGRPEGTSVVLLVLTLTFLTSIISEVRNKLPEHGATAANDRTEKCDYGRSLYTSVATRE